MKALIIGLGRAGRRHARILDMFNIEWVWFDPFLNGREEWVSALLDKRVSTIDGSYDFAVIATPPNYHLLQARECLNRGSDKVIIEKPLCGFNQLGQVEGLDPDRVMVAYNWRWHVDYRDLRGNTWKLGKEWIAYSDQIRPDIPTWGLLLDHVSHSVDTLTWLSGKTAKIEKVYHQIEKFSTLRAEWWRIHGKLDDAPLMIFEQVGSVGTHRESWIQGPFGNISPRTDILSVDDMSIMMWQDIFKWVNGEIVSPVTLAEAIEVQKVLEEINARSV